MAAICQFDGQTEEKIRLGLIKTRLEEGELVLIGIGKGRKWEV